MRIFVGVFVFFSFLSFIPAWAGDYRFDDAFIRATPMKISAAYVVIHNDGDKDDVLQRVTAPWAGKVELHQTTANDKGVMTMRAVDHMTLPAHGVLSLRPSGQHIMLFQLQRPLVAGGDVTLDLHFAKAGLVPVTFKIVPITYKGQ